MNNHNEIHTAKTASLVRVVFKLDKSDWHEHGTETMWAEPLGHDRYRLENIPFYVYGISYGDTVVAKMTGGLLFFQNVSQNGGHSTYRIFLAQGITDNEFAKHWNALESLGCTYERATERLLAVDVPPEADIYKAYEALGQGLTAQAWDFEEGHCGHQLNR